MTRREFVQQLGELIANAPGGENKGIVSMDFDDEAEIVTVTFKNGREKRVNVAMDSCATIVYDVMREV